MIGMIALSVLQFQNEVFLHLSKKLKLSQRIKQTFSDWGLRVELTFCPENV